MDLECDSEWQEQLMRTTLKFVERQVNHDPVFKSPALQDDVDAMTYIVKHGSDDSIKRFEPEQLVQSIAFGMIESDAAYLLEKKETSALFLTEDLDMTEIRGKDDDFNLGCGRPGREAKIMDEHESLAESSFFSYAVGYIIAERSAGSPIYDELILCMRERLCALRDQGPQNREEEISSIILARIINVHCHFHPFDVERISPEWRSFAERFRGGAAHF